MTGILDDMSEAHARLLEASQILPFMFDFLGVLYFIRKLWQEVIYINIYYINNLFIKMLIHFFLNSYNLKLCTNLWRRL